MLCRLPYAVLLALFLNLGVASSFQPSFSTSTRTSLFSQVDDVETKESTIKDEENNVPYSIARGDGSTGGGGLAMPHVSEEEDDGLRRPKVGAEMPVGRPSWFRVPGPSQGMIHF